MAIGFHFDEFDEEYFNHDEEVKPMGAPYHDDGEEKELPPMGAPYHD